MDHLLTVQAEHVAMFEAIEARDKDAARLAMRTHIENACSARVRGTEQKRHTAEGFCRR